MKETPPTVLYVEDDLSLSFVTQDNLELAGFQVIHCTNGGEAFIQFQRCPADICLLDIMLPEVDGLTLARQIRAINTEVPILFLTAKTLKEDRIAGLTLGADDYITKPFSIEELILRINVFLRRSQAGESPKAKIIVLGKFKMNVDQQILAGPGDTVQKLTQRETQLLGYLAHHKNRLLTREAILLHVWQDDDYFAGRSLDVFISRLRKYLLGDTTLRIENVHGVGFRLVAL